MTDPTITIPDVPTTKEEAYRAVQWCLRTVGEGYHPDNPGADYIVLSTDEFLFSPEQAVAFDAMTDGIFAELDDPSATANELEEPCYVCHRPVYLGDEPGEVLLDGDQPVPVCSDACTVVFFGMDI